MKPHSLEFHYRIIAALDLQEHIVIEESDWEPHSQIAKSQTGRVRQNDLGRYSWLVSALWLFRSLNAQIENA